MRIQILVISLVLAAVSASGKDMVVADAGDHSPVIGASIINKSGLITGFSDKSGQVKTGEGDYPITVRSIGYESNTISHKSDTLFLSPASYELNEVVVSPGERPVTRIVTYVREYCTGVTSRDTLQLYSEYMLEYFFADGKVKGFKKSHSSPHVLAVKRFARIDTPEIPDSLFQPKEGDDIEFLSLFIDFLTVPYEQHKAPEPLIAGAKGVSLEGKYGMARNYRYQNDLYIVSCDALSEYEDHTWSPWVFKVFGATMDLSEYECTYIFMRNDKHEYGIDDFVSERYNVEMKGRGKLFKFVLGVKEGIDMNCVIEQYPVSIERLTQEEYLEYKKEFKNRTADFEVPDGIEPLPAQIQKFLGRFQ